MFSLLLGLAGSILSFIGSAVFLIALIVLLDVTVQGILSCIVCCLLSVMVLILITAGMYLDKKLRIRFHLTHKRTFSLLWTIISVFELSLIVVFVITTVLGLMSASVTIWSILIYLMLSIIILGSQIKKIHKNKKGKIYK